jgi:hypothetical protein
VRSPSPAPSLITDGDDPVFQHTRLQPLLDQADDAPVADPGIHFNFYYIFHYLTALNELLPTGGRLYFDYAEPDGIELGTGENFKAHSTGH